MKKKILKKAKKKVATSNGDFSVDDIVKDLSKNYSVEVMSDTNVDRTPYFIPFKHKGLQAITGGVPGGKMTEILGDSQTGKSYLLYELIVSAIEMGGAAMLHDIERAYEPRYGKRVGLEGNKKFALSYEKKLEQIFTLSRKFILGVRARNKECPILIGMDSYPPMQTIVAQKEIEEQLKKNGAESLKGYREAKKNAVLASIIGEFITFLDENKATLVLLNQTRKAMGVVFGDDLTSNADNIIKFYVTLRLRGRFGAKVKEIIDPKSKKKKIVGAITHWETIKNRGIYPFKKVDTKIVYKTGINSIYGLTDLLIEEGIAKKCKIGNKNGLSYEGKSYATAKELIKEHPGILKLE